MSWNVPADWTTGELVTASKMNGQVRDNWLAAFAVGSYKFKLQQPGVHGAETVVDSGWLECNGASVNRTTYAALATWIVDEFGGYAFGAGDGSTSFGIPDFAGRVWATAANGGHAEVGVGQSDGDPLGDRRTRHKHTHTLTIPQHEHSIPVVTDGSVGTSSGPGNPSDSDHAAGNTLTSGGVTAFPGIDGGIGPQTGAEPFDTPAFLVGGIIAIKF